MTTPVQLMLTSQCKAEGKECKRGAKCGGRGGKNQTKPKTPKQNNIHINGGKKKLRNILQKLPPDFTVPQVRPVPMALCLEGPCSKGMNPKTPNPRYFCFFPSHRHYPTSPHFPSPGSPPAPPPSQPQRKEERPTCRSFGDFSCRPGPAGTWPCYRPTAANSPRSP